MNLVIWLIIMYFLLTSFASGIERLNRNTLNDDESKTDMVNMEYSWQNIHLLNILARPLCFETHSKLHAEEACSYVDL